MVTQGEFHLSPWFCKWSLTSVWVSLVSLTLSMVIHVSATASIVLICLIVSKLIILCNERIWVAPSQDKSQHRIYVSWISSIQISSLYDLITFFGVSIVDEQITDYGLPSFLSGQDFQEAEADMFKRESDWPSPGKFISQCFDSSYLNLSGNYNF